MGDSRKLHYNLSQNREHFGVHHGHVRNGSHCKATSVIGRSWRDMPLLGGRQHPLHQRQMTLRAHQRIAMTSATLGDPQHTTHRTPQVTIDFRTSSGQLLLAQHRDRYRNVCEYLFDLSTEQGGMVSPIRYIGTASPTLGTIGIGLHRFYHKASEGRRPRCYTHDRRPVLQVCNASPHVHGL